GVQAQDFVFVTNATSGVNAVVRSFNLRHGDELLTTNHDYNACRNVVAEAARRAAAKLVVAALPFPVRSQEEIVEAILGAVTRRKRLAMNDHVTSHTARVVTMKILIRELSQLGWYSLVTGVL